MELSQMVDDDCIIVLVRLNDKQINDLFGNIVGIKGATNISELTELYSVIDVFVYSSAVEIFRLASAGVLACGTSAIVFASISGVEIVEDRCGFAVEKANIHEVKMHCSGENG